MTPTWKTHDSQTGDDVFMLMGEKIIAVAFDFFPGKGKFQVLAYLPANERWEIIRDRKIVSLICGSRSGRGLKGLLLEMRDEIKKFHVIERVSTE